jgi:hypothetical protein
MPSRREIARDWGVAKSYVDKCVTQRACPTTSLREAREWREENARRRAPTDQKSKDREIAEQQGDQSRRLISVAAAKTIAFSGYDFILELLDSLPESVAAQCNPEHPDVARAVLDAECTAILASAYEAYAAWRL